MVSAAAGDLAADAVEREVGDLQAFGGRLAAAEERADARQEFDEGEGFDEVIVGALFEAFHAIVEGAAGAEDQDRRPDLAIADLFEDLKAVHIGQHQVENDEVVIGGVDVIERGGAVSGGVDGIAGAFESAA